MSRDPKPAGLCVDLETGAIRIAMEGTSSPINIAMTPAELRLFAGDLEDAADEMERRAAIDASALLDRIGKAW